MKKTAFLTVCVLCLLFNIVPGHALVIRPELVIANFSATIDGKASNSIEVDPGDEVPLKALIANQGQAIAGSFFCDFLISTEPGFAAPRITLERKKVAKIEAGYEKTAEFSFRAIFPGVYYLGLRIDPTNSVKEWHEGDNLSRLDNQVVRLVVREVRNADPLNTWLRPSWREGPGRVVTDHLREGRASHDLSMAELIYYSAKENKINPLVLIVLMELEQRLITGNLWSGDFEERLFWAVNYLYSDLTYAGCYPQLVAASYQFWAYRNRSMSFEQSYQAFQSQHKDWAKFEELYAKFALRINRIAGTTFSLHPASGGYFGDFLSAKITPEVIQCFLEEVGSPLASPDLFRSPPNEGSAINYRDLSMGR